MKTGGPKSEFPAILGWSETKGLVKSNMLMKYESPITYHSKDMGNVKVFKKWVKLQGHEVKYFGTNRKVLSLGTYI
jgi:hypothetical protein